MKATIVRFSVLVSLLSLTLGGLSVSASAASSKHSKKITPEDTVQSVSAAPVTESSSYSTYQPRYGLGFMSAYNLTASNGALTGWIGLTPRFGIQPLVTVSSTSPFNFAVGALGKYTIVQHGTGGFHLGGGATLGSIHAGSTGGGSLFGNTGAGKPGFALSITGLAGIHFEIPSLPNILFQFDGGATYGVIDGSADFNAGSTVGSLLGLSVIYLF